MITVFSITPSQVSRQGGETIVLTGTFPTTDTYTVKVAGVISYSGIAGQGNVIKTNAAGTELRFVMPALDISQIGASVTVLVEGSPSMDTDSTTIAVLERVFHSVPFEMRQLMQPWLAVGPRRLDLEQEEQ